jgi:prolyl oligopeptidase
MVTGPGALDYADWQELLPADSEAVLGGYAILDGGELGRPVLLAAWTRHAISEITVHDLATGERRDQIGLPGLGTIGGLHERPEGGHEAWFAYTDHTTPTAVYHYDARDGAVSLAERAPGSVAVPAVTTRQIAYQSKDGTTVRMVVIAGAEAAAGPRPAILYGYGGFNISLTPAYTPSILAWAEAGGIYAVAGLRGGSEEGEEWHRAGMREHKQNVFDDFHAAAETLIAEGLTTREQLSISGGSNGGLLVGAAITQRPDLYAAAVCSAPLLDMVRYEQFGLGETWNDEYGTAQDPAELGWLLSYSPYHHVREGVSYPAVLFTIFESDTRVDTLHARKMCAALQHATAAPAGEPGGRGRPVLLRRETDVGHSARSVSRAVGLSAETLSFAAWQTGLG